MSIDIRLPNITGNNTAEQMAQVKSYLFQLAEQLQWALNNIEASSGNVVVSTPKTSAAAADTEVDRKATFNSIKSLIIKSAEIVDAYYESISKRLEGSYVAVSDFGTYKETTSQEILANSTGITSLYENIQSIITDISELEHSLIEVNAYIHSGLLYTDDDGIPIYGLEVGQRNEVDGVEVFNQYARFTADRLSFYDQNGLEVAYISDYKLYITNAEITGVLTLGAFQINTTKGFRLKYVGRG